MIKKFILLSVAATYLSACTTTDPYTGEQKMSNTSGGALLGAGVGALAGLAVGGSPVGRRNAALIGAGVGALAGGAVGNYMDQQESELRAQLQGTGISVTRRGDNIILNMPSNITFDVDQDAVKAGFYPTLNSVAIVLRKFNRTLIDVNGHTDSTGSLQHNQDLSAAPRDVSCRLSRHPGHRSAPRFGRRLRTVATGRLQRLGSRPRPEPPRRNPDRACHPELINIAGMKTAGPTPGRFRYWCIVAPLVILSTIFFSALMAMPTTLASSGAYSAKTALLAASWPVANISSINSEEVMPRSKERRWIVDSVSPSADKTMIGWMESGW